jgi:predicted nucleotidyltransferase
MNRQIDLKKIEEIIIQNKPVLSKKFKVKDIGIFGSYVRGEQKPDSDLDVLVEFNERVGFFKFMQLEEYLENLLKVKVDLVSRKALKPRIGKNILKELVII